MPPTEDPRYETRAWNLTILFGGNVPCHPDRTRRGFDETELPVKVICRAVGDQTDIGGLRQLVLDIVRQCSHDHLAEPPALVFGHDRDVGDLKEAASVADDAAHADDRVTAHQADAKDRIGQPLFGSLSRKRAEARGLAQAQIIVNTWDVGLDAVVAMLGQLDAFQYTSPKMSYSTIASPAADRQALAL